MSLAIARARETAPASTSRAVERHSRGGPRLEEVMFATGACQFLEQSMVGAVGAHGSVAIGTARRRRRGSDGRGRGLVGRGGRDAVRVTFDPSNPHAPTFEELVRVFFDCHDPTRAPVGDDGSTVATVFVTRESQREMAMRSVEERAMKERMKEIFTRVESAADFTFTPAPERLQRRLGRAGDKVVCEPPSYVISSPVPTLAKISPVASAREAWSWVFDWVKVLLVHVATVLVIRRTGDS
ncbi:Peptide methionine sulphoxide reductase MsrA [Ostreococcus tauri]|uniref:peptide-methionine (S)-S-oxide reductase n=1 Tax=Ostreococcus tauri TaxID=70448 RepID=A0A090M2B3_OSTTA|nr:Peptide methionine sulphoxide reductase MsrA [Ostreococcus tauri]CEF98341.1 Peptide methionine sulphoxide reductase MsrA [Ostreococcus tauri]|eukprot:XP_003079840.2 Peptide methionine sulphoxide reductase MsrA [Ostreococcus tauri]